MNTNHWYIPAGKMASGPWLLDLSADGATWNFAGLRVAEMNVGNSISFTTGEYEVVVLSLSGSASINVDGSRFELKGRKDVFSGPSDFVYAPIFSQVTINATSECKIAIPAAKTDVRLSVRYVPVSGVPIEVRGAGSCTRQVNNFCTSETFQASRLIACEVLTPAGNWSSYPPHKHDELTGSERPLEEIYYFEVAPGRTDAGRGMGYQRVYSSAKGDIDVLVEVRSGDVVLVPFGWHGPSMAVPGYDLYYLNVMAGPEGREWLICDDPAHAWVRSTWQDQPIDPRVPFGESKSRG